MKWIDILLILLLAAIVAFAVLFIRREKKKGRRCIGCPCAGNCTGCGHKC